MAGFEDLIRSALKRQGDSTPEQRATIYKSSRQALERMLAQNTSLGETAIALQRNRLETAIRDIETGYSQIPPTAQQQTTSAPPPQMPTATPEPPAPVPQPAPPVSNPAPMPTPKAPPVPPPPAQSKSVRVEPGFEQVSTSKPDEVDVPIVRTAPTRSEMPTQLEPEDGGLHQSTRREDYPESYKGDALREKKPYAKMLLWTIILVGVAVAIWWAVSFGPDFVKAKLGGSVPNPSQTIESGSFVPENTDGWIIAFNPANDAGNLDASGRGTADLFQDGNANFVRLTSNAGSTRNNIRIRLPRGVMEPLQAKAVTFEILLKNPADAPHEFAVFCEFGAMGNCGRKRFSASKKVEAFIFDVLTEDVALAQNEEAHITLNTDLSGEGRPLDIYSVRVRVGK